MKKTLIKVVTIGMVLCMSACGKPTSPTAITPSSSASTEQETVAPTSENAEKETVSEKETEKTSSDDTLDELRAIAENDPAAMLTCNGYTFNMLTGTCADFISFLKDSGFTVTEALTDDVARPGWDSYLTIDTEQGYVSVTLSTPNAKETPFDRCRFSEIYPSFCEIPEFQLFDGRLSSLLPTEEQLNGTNGVSYYEDQKESVISTMESLGYTCTEESGKFICSKDFGDIATIKISHIDSYIADGGHTEGDSRSWPCFSIYWNK